MSLRDLDAKLVPRLAVLLRSALDATGRRRDAVRAGVRRRGQALVSAQKGGLLQRLDDRYASTGPLKLVRDVPQLGLLLVASVFLAGTGAALALSGPATTREVDEGRQDSVLPLSLGPAVGADIDAHFVAARERLLGVANRDGDGRHLALVSLNKALAPDEVGTLLAGSGLELRRAYLMASVSGLPEEIVFQTQDDDVVAALDRVFAETAKRKLQEQQDLLETARTIEPGTPEEEAFRRLYLTDAQTAGEEAAAYGSDCACVFALVVEAPARELAELLALPVVRGVEAAPRGAELAALDVRPLQPSQQGVVRPLKTRSPTDGQ